MSILKGHENPMKQHTTESFTDYIKYIESACYDERKLKKKIKGVMGDSHPLNRMKIDCP